MPTEHDLESGACDPRIVALAHPSLDHAVAEFAAEMRNEQRFFASATPKLRSSSLELLTADRGLRHGSMIDQRLIAMSRVGSGGRAVIAVTVDWRGRGVGRQLLLFTLQRAAAYGHRRVVFHSGRRSRAFVDLAESIGAVVVDQGCGRLDVVFAIERSARIA